MLSDTNPPRVGVIGSSQSAWSSRVAGEVEFLFPDIEVNVLRTPEKCAELDVLIATDTSGCIGDCADTRVVWFLETYSNANANATYTPQPAAVICRSSKDVTDLASFAWFAEGIHLVLMPPADGNEALGDADLFRRAIDGRFEIALAAESNPQGYAWIFDRIRAQRPGCFFAALDNERVLAIEPNGTTVPVEGVTARDALAATRLVVCTGSDYEGMARAWHHWRPTLVRSEDRNLANLSDVSGGGLWFDDHALEEPAAFLLQHPQIGNVIGSQGRRWIEFNGSPKTRAARWASALGIAS